MRMAAALRQRVFLMAGLYRGGNRYEVVFEELADFSQCPAAAPSGRRSWRLRSRAMSERLEHYARAAPDNWFNFHDFWGTR
jgi:predicted LPLAT superfamily acyltransferase